MEAAQDLDLLDQLALPDEGALAARAVDIALLGEVDHGLADRSQADPEHLGEATFSRELGARPQPALLDALEDRDLDLVVKGCGAVAVHLTRQPLLHREGRHGQR
jgi:hypothetical protein